MLGGTDQECIADIGYDPPDQAEKLGSDFAPLRAIASESHTAAPVAKVGVTVGGAGADETPTAGEETLRRPSVKLPDKPARGSTRPGLRRQDVVGPAGPPAARPAAEERLADE